MKHTFILAISALLLCACNESIKYGPECKDGDIPRCTDDYHYVKCDGGTNKKEACCSDADIAAGKCKSVCMMRASGAVCEEIKVDVEQPECGNGKLESGEQCDGQDLNGNSCANKYGVNAKGQPVCDPVTCQVRYDACEPDTTKCGDGIIDPGEDCDGNALDNHTCEADVAGSTGTLKCTDNCKFDYSDCRLPKCGNGRIDDGETCDTTVPASLSCASVTRGSTGSLSCSNLCQIDFSGCSVPKAGDRCDISGDLNNGGCDDKGRYFYCQDGVIHVHECAYHELETDGVCAVYDLDDGNWKAGCIENREACDNPGEIKRRCADSNDYQTALNVCRRDAISGRNFWVEADDPRYESCPYVCVQETGTCGKLSDLDGVLCDRQTDIGKCEGNVMVNCTESKHGDKYVATQCHEKCVVYDMGPQYLTLAGCVFEEEDKCQVGDPDIKTCYGDSAFVLTCSKVLGDTNGYLIADDWVDCPNGCDPETGECVKFDEEEGKRCTSRSKPKCVGDDMLMYCNEDKVFASQVCIGNDGNIGACITEGDSAKCYERCTQEGATRTKCIETSANSAYTSVETCENVDGVLIYKENVEKSENCASYGCNADKTGCVKFLDNDGSKCNGDTTSVCIGDILSWCERGRRSSIDCSIHGSDYACAILDDGEGWCMEKCDSVGQQKKECVYDDEDGFITKTRECITSANGEKVYSTIDIEACSEGCNDTWDACVHCTPGDIMTQCVESYGEYGFTYYYECIVKDGIPVWSPMVASDGQGVADICPDSCNRDKTYCNIVLEEQGQACDSSFKSKCVDGYRVECSQSGHVTAERCEEGTSCHTSPAMGNTNCSMPCSTPVAPYTTCVTFAGYGSYIYGVSCEQVDGGLYNFQNVLQQCANGCNAAETACK